MKKKILVIISDLSLQPEIIDSFTSARVASLDTFDLEVVSVDDFSKMKDRIPTYYMIVSCLVFDYPKLAKIMEEYLLAPLPPIYSNSSLIKTIVGFILAFATKFTSEKPDVPLFSAFCPIGLSGPFAPLSGNYLFKLSFRSALFVAGDGGFFVIGNSTKKVPQNLQNFQFRV